MSAPTKNLMVIYGTRPEAIKVAPIILAAREADGIHPQVVVTGQHREMLDQVNGLFGIVPDIDLDIFEHGQTLVDISSRTLGGVAAAIEEMRPDAVLVQGDTTTSAFAALAAFYAQVPVIHLEAGLRTGNIYSPFPEEVNRKIITQVAALSLAPTQTSRENLLREGVDPASVLVTGNSVVDALLHVSASDVPVHHPDLVGLLEGLADDDKVLLVTTHRRENLGDAMTDIGRAIARIARAHPALTVIMPLHRNPKVRERVLPEIEGLGNVHVLDPLEYGDFSRILRRAEIVLTDSGGVQEEAPALGKPVLVLRENTERPEAVDAGTVKLIGTDEQRIVDEVSQLLTDVDAYSAMANAVNPYGDGQTAARTILAIRRLFGEDVDVEEF
ncbi:non-hydrolyzing UDP-N-acetylglucosamine 2-epimerase [Microbacterium oxydans]|uniref:non-hydrolyzing UDP-N-acetylglucosamine 2-epimerase n=1 Tax=Microbacterium oxydans TaxID=82380 RepID=UPI00226BA3EC|nr:UDP-N-acetylglucosamine 2-epimerase (non-hydrolyzing) [Microbacterium oxydans]WAA67390.1 UDP-N-acetylglucosamine 2-epimerase (non-hydrolyzing) [Microbacterium oxydans]